MDEEITSLEASLNDFSPEVRQRALEELVARAARGEVPLAPETEVANMHGHTFFSYNAYGHSPTSWAWLARRRGFRVVGSVDFDVLDGVDEFLAACDLAGVRGAAGIETRVYVPRFSTREINSPGEPGVAYHMGVGFASGRVPVEVEGILADLRQRAARRNQEMLARVNDYLGPVAIDYERDVLPLTPSGNATERHLLAAYLQAAARLPDPSGFWAAKLHLPREEVQAMAAAPPRLPNLIRTRLMKRGGVGYVQPGPESFPTVAEFHRLVVACGALPCVAWLDGTSSGEQAIEELLDLWLSQGVAVLNIIPDRNWNIADPDQRRLKVSKLYEVARLAQEADLSIIAGTEMNSPGQKLVDDFASPELQPLQGAFMEGAYLLHGHTALERGHGIGYGSAWAQAHLPSRRARNAFYACAGRLLPPGPARPAACGPEVTPGEVLAALGGSG